MNGPVVILLIENDESDVFLFRRAIQKLCYECRIYGVSTLTAARSYLENSGPYANKAYYPPPALIISDFNLTGETGLDFVRWLKGAAATSQIPFVVLCGDPSRVDTPELRALGVADVLGKTADLSALMESLRPHLPWPQR